MALDEACQICPCPIPSWVADSGGKGVTIVTVAHGLAQLREYMRKLVDRKRRHPAEDVVSDSLVTAFQRIKQFDAMRPFAPWFYRIVINAAKKSRRRRSIESRAYRRLSTAASSVDATAEALAADERREVFAAVQALATEERVVVVLHYYLEASISDMVDLLGWPSGTVKRRLYNARQRLRARLGRRLGVELDEKEVGQWFASATQTPR